MSQDEIRFRFSRRFEPNTDLGQMAEYIAHVSQRRGRNQSEILFDLICAKYLPLSSKKPGSTEGRLQAIHSIYFLEAAIQEILAFHGMDDPRPKSGEAARTASLNREIYLGESGMLSSLEDADEPVDADDEPVDEDDLPDSGQSIQSTVNRMRI